MEGLQGQMQQDRRILADGIEHHRVVAFGDHFAHDVDALGFELLQMSQCRETAAGAARASASGGSVRRPWRR